MKQNDEVDGVADGRFIGTWMFETAEFATADGSATDPYGPGTSGMVVYDRLGHMTVQLFGGGRPSLGSDDVLAAEPTRVIEAYSAMTGYFGTYAVSPEHGVVTHVIEAATHPDWQGRTLRRHYEFDGDRLTLATDPYVVGGRLVTGRLTWRRVA